MFKNKEFEAILQRTYTYPRKDKAYRLYLYMR
jgi:hypothetical protein